MAEQQEGSRDGGHRRVVGMGEGEYRRVVVMGEHRRVVGMGDTGG